MTKQKIKKFFFLTINKEVIIIFICNFTPFGHIYKQLFFFHTHYMIDVFELYYSSDESIIQ